MKKTIDRSLIYPSIKLINKDKEIKMDLVKNDVLPSSIGEAIYFRVEYRLEKTTIDCLAEKYSAKIEDYAEDFNDEHFLIGSTVCKKSITDLDCKYMAKVWDILRINKIKLNTIFGIYLLNMDESEDNSQKFIALAMDKVYIRWQTKKLEEFLYTDLIFDKDGIKSRYLIVGLAGENRGYVVDYCFDEQFLFFANEIMLLKTAVMDGINETHPVSILPLEKKKKYLSFLINISASTKNLTAKKLLKLEYLAREFGIDAEEIVKNLKTALKGGIKDNRLSNLIASIVAEVLPEEIRYVFYQEALEFTVSEKGKVEREKLHQIISRNSYAGESFVRYYCDFLRLDKEAQACLQHSFLQTEYPVINLQDLYRLQKYNHALTMQILSIGVKYNV